MEKTLNDYCIDFQQNIIDLFNNEQNLPFVLKYYLIKDIWENIQSTKTKMDIDSKSKQIKEETVEFDLEDKDENIEKEEEM